MAEDYCGMADDCVRRRVAGLKREMGERRALMVSGDHCLKVGGWIVKYRWTMLLVASFSK